MSDIVKTIIRAETRKERLQIACEGFAEYINSDDGREFARAVSIEFLTASNRNLINMPPQFFHHQMNENEFVKPIQEALNGDFGLQSKFRHYSVLVLTGYVLSTVNRLIAEDDLNNFYAELAE